jgi:iron complex transport system ATP-binding protein
MLLEISDVSFSYDRKKILDSISLKVNAGEQWAIIGKNGCGKSTLLKCIAGLEKVCMGSIKVAGKNIQDFSTKERARFISYVPQFTDRNMPFSVYDYVMMSRYAYQESVSIAAGTDNEIVGESLLLTETEQFKDRRMNTLSGGEQQRVFLAGAVAQQSNIILLDEPTTFLDPFQVRNMSSAMKKIMKRYNTTILSVSHELNYSINLHSNVLAIKDGRAYFSGSINELMENDLSIVSTLFEVPFEKVCLSSGIPFILPRFE